MRASSPVPAPRGRGARLQTAPVSRRGGGGACLGRGGAALGLRGGRYTARCTWSGLARRRLAAIGIAGLGRRRQRLLRDQEHADHGGRRVDPKLQELPPSQPYRLHLDVVLSHLRSSRLLCHLSLRWPLARAASDHLFVVCWSVILCSSQSAWQGRPPCEGTPRLPGVRDLLDLILSGLERRLAGHAAIQAGGHRLRCLRRT